jgi:hypothetical protein
MFQNLIAFVLLSFALAGFGLSAPHSPLDYFMLKVDEKLEETIQMNVPLLGSAMLLNETRFYRDFQLTIGSFKSGLITRMRSDIVELAKETKATRKANGQLSLDEKTDFVDKLQGKWEISLNKEIKSWTKQTLVDWAHKAKDLWVGFEDQVKTNLRTLKDFFERHLRKSS